MISVAQVRAARALLGIKQSELAQMAGLSLTAINNLEREIGSPRLDTMNAIEKALDASGILFLEDDGVKRRGEPLEIIRHEGAHVVRALTDDMLEHLPYGAEVLMCGIDERKFTEFEEEDVMRYARAARDRDLKERILAREGDTYFVSEPEHYRWVSEDSFGKIPYLIYGDRVVFMLWEAPRRCLILRNPSIVDMFRTQFEFLWSHAKVHGLKTSSWDRVEDVL